MPRKAQAREGTWEDTGPGVTVEDDRYQADAYQAETVTEDQVEDGPRPSEVPSVPLFAPTEAGEVIDGGDRPVSSGGAAPREAARSIIGEGLAGDLEDVPGYEEKAARRLEREAARDAGEGPLLDAWYAIHPEEALAVAVAKREARDLLEVVIGFDDRTQITNTTVVPWRWICSLRITAGDGSTFIGTGWLVAPRTVITAGHCVFIANHGGWVRSIEVAPGRNGAQRPLGRCTSTSFRSVVGWTQFGHRNYDYGAIILPRDCGFGQLGGFGFAALSDATLRALRLNLAGYPGDKPDGTMWYHARNTKSVTSRTIVYDIDTAGGQSGAPVWRNVNGVRHVVGIHTNGSLTGNSATRIVTPVFNNLVAWKAEGA